MKESKIKCVCCGRGTLENRVQALVQEYEGEEVRVNAEVSICNYCQYMSLRGTQADVLRKLVKAAHNVIKISEK